MSEKNLHKSVCDYLRYAYPTVMFNSDLAGSMKLSMYQAAYMKNLRSNRGFPDITIYEPRGGFHGLFLELKREGERIFTSRGKPSTPHVAEQAEVMERLASRGYMTAFAVGFDAAKKMIDDYLNNRI